MPLSANDLKRWRERIRHARDLYRDWGILGDSARGSTMRELIDFYRGDHWKRVDHMGLEEEALRTVNKIFSVWNTMAGQIASRNPEMQLLPYRKEDLPRSFGAQALLNRDAEEQNHIEQLSDCAEDHFAIPAGCLRHGFTPEEEFFDDSGRIMQTYRPARPDVPWIKREPMWNVLLDPKAERWHQDGGMNWVAFRSIMRLEHIRNNPRMIDRQGLQDFAGNVTPEWLPMRQQDLREQQDPDQNDYVEVFTVYEAWERSWFQITLDGPEKPLREQADWPLGWSHLPVNVFLVNQQRDTPRGIPLLEAILPLQKELNIVRTMMSLMVRRMRRILAVQANEEKSTLAKIQEGDLNEIVRTTGRPSEVMQEFSISGFPPELLSYNALIEQDSRETIGQSLMNRAQRINVETAHEVERVNQGADIHTGRILLKFERFVEDAERLYLEGRRDAMREANQPELVPLVGQARAEGLAQFLTVEPSDLAPRFGLRVVHGSTAPRNREREIAEAGTHLDLAIKNPNYFDVAWAVQNWVEVTGNPPDAINRQIRQQSDVAAADAARRTAQVGQEGASQDGSTDALAAFLASNARGVAQ